MTAPPKLIVLERTGRLARALRTVIAGNLPVMETRSLGQVFDELQAAQASMVVIDAAAIRPDQLIAGCFTAARAYPLAATAVVLSRSQRDFQWQVREAGAIYVTFGQRRLEPLAAIAARHLQRSPKPAQTIAERILASMPLSGGR